MTSLCSVIKVVILHVKNFARIIFIVNTQLLLICSYSVPPFCIQNKWYLQLCVCDELHRSYIVYSLKNKEIRISDNRISGNVIAITLLRNSVSIIPNKRYKCNFTTMKYSRTFMYKIRQKIHKYLKNNPFLEYNVYGFWMKAWLYGK